MKESKTTLAELEALSRLDSNADFKIFTRRLANTVRAVVWKISLLSPLDEQLAIKKARYDGHIEAVKRILKDVREAGEKVAVYKKEGDKNA